ncbi:hypothetical protein [Reyranella sp. CPCC 100927]|uniref:hypothetical protein n=1 Tax=Reyranella sp. CPCC 100927 TaxID=2599616 RepID=UPI0011B6BA5B|nr:hypothetical protein [Reyranella sp. CPCC 100927]TWS93660.1 hypothetical protein FQU96_41715 [Reyranella sp. CPCC 100927]
MDVLTLGLYPFALGAFVAGVLGLAWGLVLILKNPDRKSRADGTISVGGGAVAIAAAVSALSWAALAE